jgi:dTDP-4-amino-4,6-dideoxygalactose transaminase
MEAETMAVIRDVLARGDLMLRQQLRDFEEHLAAFVGTKYCVGTSNCTDALHLAYRAAGIGPGDEVITVSHTFVATAAAVVHAGATPVFVDIGDDHQMDVDMVEAAITPRTKAIVPVHLNGRLVDMPRLLAIAERHGLPIIEDSAQALGGSVQGRRGGSWGLAGAFSFYPAKLLGAPGDAGALTTDSPEMYEKVRQLRDHGRMADGGLSGWSFNCRLDNLHAAILDLRLAKVPEWIARRRAVAAIYQEELAGVPQLLLPPPPADGAWFDVFQNYEIEAERRDALVARLKERGVEILLPWGGRAIHQFPRLGLGHYAGRLPRTERCFERVLMLPMHCELEDSQVRYVAEVIRDFYAG